jgi:hypothetical protein
MFVMAFASPAPGGGVPYEVSAMIGDREVPVGVGSVIGAGQRVGDQCFIPASEIRFTFPDNRGAYALEIRSGVNDNCDLVIESIKQLKNPPTSPPASDGGVAEEPTEEPTGVIAQTAEQEVTEATGVRHFGWARHRVEEYFNITVTYTYVEMKYTRDGGHVWAGTSPLCRWWNDGIGWSVTSKGCTWDYNGPSAVWIKAGYHFSNAIPPRPAYTLWARFIADPGPRRTCSLTNGEVPLGWDSICTGGIYW